MTAFQDQINTALRDYVVDGNPGSGNYSPVIADLRSILNTAAVGAQWITDIENFLNAASVSAARTAINLGAGDTATFGGLAVLGSVAVDTSVFVVDAVNNRVGIGTALPTQPFQVTVASTFGSTLAVTGAVTFSADLTVDTSTFRVDATNNRVGVGTASPVLPLDVVGEARVTAASSTNAFRVVQTGSGNVVLFEDSASTDSNPWLIDQEGVVVQGHTASIAADNGVVTNSQSHGLTNRASHWVNLWSADAVGSSLKLGKSRGTAVGTRGAVSLNDTLGSLMFIGDDGAAFRVAAEIRGQVDATWSSGEGPGRLVFLTTLDGSATPTERMRIDNTGFISLGGDLDTGFWSPGANEIAFWSGGAEVMRLEETGKVIVGGYTQSEAVRRDGSSFSSPLQIHGAGAAFASASLVNWSSSAASEAILTLGKSKSNVPGTRTAVTNGDTVGALSFVGDDGTNFINGARITATVGNTVSTGVVPTGIVIATMNAAGTMATRFEVTAQGTVQPGTDNTQTLGSASFRWNRVFAGTGTIDTSDAREKDWLGGLTTAELAAANAVLAGIGTFQFKDAVAEKGAAAARHHAGVTAQAVAMSLMGNGLNPESYAFWCADAVPGGIRYGVRYNELAMFLIAALDARLRTLEAA